MTRTVNIIVQITAIAGQFLVPVFFTTRQKEAHAVIGFIQAAGALIAHNFNPDGTAATVAYRPEPK